MRIVGYLLPCFESSLFSFTSLGVPKKAKAPWCWYYSLKCWFNVPLLSCSPCMQGHLLVGQFSKIHVILLYFESNQWLSSLIWRILIISMQYHKDFSSFSQFYVSDCKNNCKLKVYDVVSDLWSKHIDNKMHLRNSQAFKVVVLVSFSKK